MEIKDYTESPNTSDSEAGSQDKDSAISADETPPISSDEESIPTAILAPENPTNPEPNPTGSSQEPFRQVTMDIYGLQVPAILRNDGEVYVKRGTMELIVGEFESRNAIKFRLLLRRWVRTGRIMSHTIDLTTREDYLNNSMNWVDDLFKLHEVARMIREHGAIGTSLLDLDERAKFHALTEKFTGL